MQQKPRCLVRPVRTEDVLALIGRLYDKSFRGLAAEIEGEVIGICGVLHTHPLQLFSEMTPRLREYPRAIVEGGREMMVLMDEYVAPIYSTPDPEQARTEEFLVWLGFDKVKNGVFVRYREQ